MLCEKEMGSYIVPDGWHEADFSFQHLYVYSKEKLPAMKKMDNISVIFGKNPYPQEEHQLFRAAIIKQLQPKLRLLNNPDLYAYGSMTEKGIVLYVFEVTEEDGALTRFCYLVGDHCFCMVQESNYDHSEDYSQAAKKLVHSFEWKNDPTISDKKEGQV